VYRFCKFPVRYLPENDIRGQSAPLFLTHRAPGLVEIATFWAQAKNTWEERQYTDTGKELYGNDDFALATD